MSFHPLQSPSKNSGLHRNYNFQNGDSYPHTLLHSWEHEMWLPASLLAHTFTSPCLGHEPKPRVATHCEKYRVSCFMRANPHSSIAFSLVFIWLILPLPTPFKNKLGIAWNFFLWGGYDISGSSEGKILLQLLPNKCVFPSCHRGLWVSSVIGLHFFSSMC